MNDTTMTSFSTEQLTSRSGIYRLLSRLFVRELDLSLLRQLHDPALREPLAQAAIHLPEPNSKTVETLAIDYCQLFLGPRQHLPPFQSVWQAGQFHGDTTVLMRRYIDVIGYVPDDTLSEMYLDHLGIQFNVMAEILAQLAGAVSRAEPAGPLHEIEQSFFAAHLHWPTALLEAAEQKATTDFYRCMVAFTRQFLVAETQLFES